MGCILFVKLCVFGSTSLRPFVFPLGCEGEPRCSFLHVSSGCIAPLARLSPRCQVVALHASYRFRVVALRLMYYASGFQWMHCTSSRSLDSSGCTAPRLVLF